VGLKSAKGSDAFEPPKYLASLIAAVNDGAKAAQAGALVFALVGVYLLATAFSASDEDLLRGRTVTISQIGATLPVSFSFAIAPFVFVFLHIYTLARYDMLAANVRQFLAELVRTVPLEADRERCRQLLANVEFIQALVASPGSSLYSPVWRWLVWGMVAVFPVFVLLLVQINALRYQSEVITRVQQFGVLLDISALVWFFHRAPLDGSAPRPASRMAEVGRWAKLLWLPAIVMGLNLVYLNVVPADTNVGLVRYEGRPQAIWGYLTVALRQPLDVVLCPSLKWGCRYLRVDHRTLVDHVWDEKAMADLRRGGTDQVKLAAIEGLVLRDRSLRFAVLAGSSLFAADLNGADLRAASFENAGLLGTKLSDTSLQGADLSGARLEGADLSGAQLQRAILTYAQLRGANLYSAQLERAHFIEAQLAGANLHFAQLKDADLERAGLQGANLSRATLSGANLTGTQLQGADLRGAELLGAELREANLQGAALGEWRLRDVELRDTQLQGADLTEAQLQGADLTGAQLQAADLTGVRLWRAKFTTTTHLDLSDLREVDFTTPLTDDEIKVLHAALNAIPEARSIAADKQLGRLLAGNQLADQVHFFASPERPVLVSDPKASFLADIPTEWLITSPTPAYTDALIADLELLASGDFIASGIAFRAADGIPYDRRYVSVACRLLANAAEQKVKLEQRSIIEQLSVDVLSKALRDQKIDCEPSKPTAPH
jgi:uncharacterized protein YjbI with pentapeptide repeats